MTVTVAMTGDMSASRGGGLFAGAQGKVGLRAGALRQRAGTAFSRCGHQRRGGVGVLEGQLRVAAIATELLAQRLGARTDQT